MDFARQNKIMTQLSTCPPLHPAPQLTLTPTSTSAAFASPSSPQHVFQPHSCSTCPCFYFAATRMAAMCAPLPQPQRHNCRMRAGAAGAIMSAGQVLCSSLHACSQVTVAQRSSGETRGRAEVCTLSFANKQQECKHGTAPQQSNGSQQDNSLGKWN
jgi:hypothetical protein